MVKVSVKKSMLENSCSNINNSLDLAVKSATEHIVAPNGGYCVLYYPSNIFPNKCGFENWGIFAHMTRLEQLRAIENI